MIKEQTFEILNTINQFHPNFEITQQRIDAWHFILKNHEFDEVKNNLIRHVATNAYLPKVSDLITQQSQERVIPDKNETRQIMSKWKPKKTASDESVKKAQSEIRKILGIKRSC